MGTTSNAEGMAQGLAGLVLALGVAAAAVGIMLPLNQLTQPGGTVAVSIIDPAARGLDQPLRQAGSDVPVALEADDPVRLTAAELPAPVRVLTETSALVRGLLGLAAAWLLRAVLRDIAASRPFTDRVPRRLTGLAVLAGVYAVLPAALDVTASMVVLDHVGLAGDPTIASVGFGVDSAMLLVAGLLLVTAAVFRHGAELAHDVEGLV